MWWEIGIQARFLDETGLTWCWSLEFSILFSNDLNIELGPFGRWNNLGFLTFQALNRTLDNLQLVQDLAIGYLPKWSIPGSLH